MDPLTIGLVVLGVGLLAGCAEEDKFPDKIPPLDKPDPKDKEIPDEPRPNFDKCFGPKESFQLMVEGGGLGCSLFAVDRAKICLEGEPCSENNSFLQKGSGGDQLRFTGQSRWVSYPIELFTGDPGDPGYGLMAQRTQRRASGEAISTFGYGDDYPAVAGQLGLGWAVEGIVTLSDCSVEMAINGTVFDPVTGNYTDTADHVAFSFYTPRGDGLLQCSAEAQFTNEAVRVKIGPAEVSFSPEQIEGQEGVPACSGDCSLVPSATDPGQEDPATIDLRLIRQPFEEPGP